MTAGRRVGGGDFVGQTFPGRSLHVILFQYTKKTRFPARLGHLSDSVGLNVEVAESATGPFWTVVVENFGRLKGEELRICFSTVISPSVLLTFL